MGGCNYTLVQHKCHKYLGTDRVTDPTDRYFVSWEQWPRRILPQYCSGVFILYTIEAARRITNTITHLGIDYVTSFRMLPYKKDIITHIILDVQTFSML
jgi:hypothetical protein